MTLNFNVKCLAKAYNVYYTVYNISEILYRDNDHRVKSVNAHCIESNRRIPMNLTGIV